MMTMNYEDGSFGSIELIYTFVPTIKAEPVKNDINPSLVLEIIKDNQAFKELILMQSSQINKLIEREQALATHLRSCEKEHKPELQNVAVDIA
jgi:hypothetical protein